MSVSVTLRTARATIENAIVDTLIYALGNRLPPSADVPTLRGLPSTALSDRSVRYVTSQGLTYQFLRADVNADDGVNYIRPSDISPSAPGRWRRSSLTGYTSSAQTGYLRRCELYNDDASSPETISQRIFGQPPACLVSFDDAEYELKSPYPTSIYYVKYHFTVFAVSVNFRGLQYARQGGPIAAESSADPGTEAIIGDVEALLSGSNLGVVDVGYVKIDREQPVVRDIARARFVEAIEITVFATLTDTDSSIAALSNPYDFNVNYQLSDANPSGVLDTANDVTSSGLQFALGDGLSKSFVGGTMNFNGSPLTVPGGAFTFQANKITYRDVGSTGALTYTATNFGDPPPPLGYGLVRLGVTVTDGTGVRADRLLAAQVLPFIGTDKDEPPPLQSLSISPTNISVPTGTAVQFTVTATYTDGSQADMTNAGVTWSVPSQVSTTPAGVLTPTSPGTYNVSCSAQGVASNTATLTGT